MEGLSYIVANESTDLLVLRDVVQTESPSNVRHEKGDEKQASIVPR